MSTYADHIEAELSRLREAYGDAMADSAAQALGAWREHDPNLHLVRAGSIA